MARRVLTNCRYVSCVSPSEWHPGSSRAPRSRKTKGFKNESEAKQFAKSMLSEGFEVTAGTLNPHLPKMSNCRLGNRSMGRWKGTARHRSETIRHPVEIRLKAKGK